ncbi:MAG: NUDIX hydrolase [Sphingopyxis sp.]|nr:NUDIX hydrolase [Sphingopyxis sp.]
MNPEAPPGDPGSAGIIFCRRSADGTRVLLVHPGGPYWRNREKGGWQIPKGAIEPGETPLAAACREAEEELGIAVSGPAEPLGSIRQAGGKAVAVFAREQEVDISSLVSNDFLLEWPPRSGRRRSFPEIDVARWLTLAEAEEVMLASQRPLLARLAMLVRDRDAASRPPPAG